jgi:hypothetical protein
MNIELNSYGICLDSEWTYIAIDWKLITLAVIGYVGYKFYKRKKNK